MKVTTGKIPGLLIIQPSVFEDERGYFFESFNEKKLEEHTGPMNWVQDNESGSIKGVFRGFHYQIPPFGQAKLVRVSKGAVLDIAVDIRPESPHYGQAESIVLSEENKTQFLIPEGFAHAYLVLSEYAVFNYKCNNYYAPGKEGGIHYKSIKLDTGWPIDPDKLILSKKDLALPEFGNHLPYSE